MSTARAGALPPAIAADRLEQLARELDEGEKISQAFAAAMVAQAIRNASSRPSPQARMASTGLEVRGVSISGPATTLVRATTGESVQLGDVLAGSEFGSSRFSQFGSRSDRGKWLWPAADDAATLEKVETEALDPLLEDVTR